MLKRDLKDVAGVTNAQLVAAANILGFGDQQEYSDEQAQAILDYLAPRGESQAHLPTQPVTSEQETGLTGSLSRVAGAVNSSVEQLLMVRDQYVEDTAHLIAHEIVTTPHAIQARVHELLEGVGFSVDSAQIFPALSRAATVLSQPLRRQSRVEKRSLTPASYLMLTASCAP